MQTYEPKHMKIKRDIKITDYLRKIFAYYKIEYNLKAELTFNDIGDFSFDYISIIITMCIDCYQLDECKEPQLIKILLHEIKHAIDCEKNIEQYHKEQDQIKNRDLYMHDKQYHDTMSFEKRANSFAEQEKDNWIYLWHNIINANLPLTN